MPTVIIWKYVARLQCGRHRWSTGHSELMQALYRSTVMGALKTNFLRPKLPLGGGAVAPKKREVNGPSPSVYESKRDGERHQHRTKLGTGPTRNRLHFYPTSEFVAQRMHES
ncbi:unnamed protein product [Pieris macdunnoughi]|uniref:Uncharacterized protein n=1 Tax=Pieris macdunnoughi TaxID=345717 RepID=A0A821TDG9_9NEOP|nr:unnamed protein product [Pieris macdunnoughi]